MNLLGRCVAGGLLLLTACNRSLYVGYDERPTSSNRQQVAGQQALPPAVADDPEAPIEAQSAQQVAVEQTAPPVAPTMMMTLPAAEPPMTESPMAETEPPLVCGSDSADCDGDPANGCEVDLLHDRMHCGDCSAACHSDDCQCDDGQLLAACDDVHADCDGDPANGCEANLMESAQHCGACGSLCHGNGHDVVEATCVAGRCEITCEPRISPEADCDGDPDNGCETYLFFDRANCGECGNVCLTNCEGGLCMI